MIPEPQRTYLLELFDALGPAAEDFVMAGAQAMKFAVEKVRATKDVDFLLNVLALRKEPLQLAQIFEKLGYIPVPESRNFQFEKPIPNNTEKMRIEFLAPEEYKRERDFRVHIQDGVHARACTGGSIALAQSDLRKVSGKLPNGKEFTAQVRVTQPHALVMLKLLALADRYSNLREPKEGRHDREEAQTHAADIVAIVTAVPDIARFNSLFFAQFLREAQLGIRILRVLGDFFREVTAPGLIVYTEYLAANLPADRTTAELLRRETELAQRIVAQILPPPEFFALAAAVDDSTEPERGAPFVEQYLATLETARIPVTHALALQSLPAGAFSGAYKPGATFVMSASEPLQKVSAAQRDLLQSYLQWKVNVLRRNERLRRKFPHTLKD
ncbi:MAG: GSU2403 family nucleotidyltransferase fold protein [Candidatus Acidiferrum sp.]